MKGWRTSPRLLDWLIGLFLLGLVAWLVSARIGWSELLAPWRQLRFFDVVGLVALTSLSWLLRAVRVYDYFHREVRGSFGAILFVSVLHNTANNLLPMRTGELAFPLLMKRKLGMSIVETGGGLLWIRFLDLHFLALVILAALYLRAGQLLWLVLGFIWLSSLLLPQIVRCAYLGGGDGGGKVGAMLALVAGATPRSFRKTLRLYLWSALSWTTKMLAFGWILANFTGVDAWQALIGAVGGELSSVLPLHGVAGAGSYEVAVVGALFPFGVEPDTALAGAVNLHLFLLGVTLLFGTLAAISSLVVACVPGLGRSRRRTER